MKDDALIEAMARAICNSANHHVWRAYIPEAIAALAVCRPIIEATLRAENEKLRAACQSIKIMFETKWSWSSQHKIDIACREIAAALKEAE